MTPTARRFPFIALTFLLSFVPLALEAANDARILVSESAVPGSVAPGAIASVRVRVLNTGTTLWRAQDGFRLGAADNQLVWQGQLCGGYMRSVTDGRVYLCHDVAPGGAHDFQFQVAAPSTTGTFRLAVRMVRDGVEWFGESRAWNVNVAATATYDAVIDAAASAVPSAVDASGSAAVRVRVRNTGSATWSAAAGYRLGTASANGLSWSSFECGGYMNHVADGRAFLCRDVPPGGTYDFNFRIASPSSATGSSALAVRMVRDGVTWFGETRSWAVEVIAPVSLPDVVVTAVNVEPQNPAPGQLVTFRSVVRNEGTASTPSGVPIGVGYFVDGAYRTWGAITTPLAPGASATITTQGGAWTASAGSHVLRALVDDIDRFAESNETNNDRSVAFDVVDTTPSGGGLYGINIDPANPAGNPSPEILRDLGARWVRIEWKSYLGYGFFDAAVARHRAQGLKVLLIVDYASVPGSPPSSGSDSAWNDYINRFVADTSAIASHYGDNVDAWQIWNEPDLFGPGTGYDPGIRPELYGRMLGDATAVIRARSTRPVVTGGLASGDPNYLARARNAIGGLPVDAVAVHPYGQRAPDDWPNTGWGFGNMSTLFDRYLAFGLPLWVTEIGTVDTSLQASYLANVYELVESRYASRVEHVFWFCWSDGMVPPFGVVDANGQPKPAYWQYRAMAPP